MGVPVIADRFDVGRRGVGMTGVWEAREWWCAGGILIGSRTGVAADGSEGTKLPRVEPESLLLSETRWRWRWRDAVGGWVVREGCGDRSGMGREACLSDIGVRFGEGSGIERIGSAAGGGVMASTMAASWAWACGGVEGMTSISGAALGVGLDGETTKSASVTFTTLRRAGGSTMGSRSWSFSSVGKTIVE